MRHAGAGSILDALIDKYANSPLKLLTPQVISALMIVVHYQLAAWCTSLHVRMLRHIARPALSSALAHVLNSYSSCVMPHMVHDLFLYAMMLIVHGFVAGDSSASQGWCPHRTCLTTLLP